MNYMHTSYDIISFSRTYLALHLHELGSAKGEASPSTSSLADTASGRAGAIVLVGAWQRTEETPALHHGTFWKVVE
jgi:hypothetical protein